MEYGASILTGLGAVITSVTLFSLIIRAQNKRIDDIEEECMKEVVHEVICENASLRINAHITSELGALKDDIFKEIRKQNK